MSDSRLEKFIYAICSMDVSNLPVPLSRIEKLWNCLITGEIPDFEPLSRNEKYLMAMLDRYDISNLPAPMSRGEKLLYKIAVGETDLSDVPGYLSRYEELLKYLIENGGISGGDFKYVLYTFNQTMYTLYTTAEKPVKSAILKGNTLVNVNIGFTSTWGGIIVSQSEVSSIGREITTWDFNKTLLESNTRYLISCDCKANLAINKENGIVVYCDGGTNGYSTFTNGLNSFTFTTGDLLVDNNRVHLGIQLGKDNVCDVVISNIMIIKYQEGMENWDIPYFEGMQSVKMPVLTTMNVVNLLDVKQYEQIGTIEYIFNNIIDSRFEKTFTFVSNGGFYNSWVKPFETNEFGEKIIGGWNFDIQSEKVGVNNKLCFTVPNDVDFFKLQISHLNGTEQLSYGFNDYSYGELKHEPFKSNILTVNEPVELRGIGEVKDELNCLTGEVTERIGEIVLNGSENWIISQFTRPNHLRLFFTGSKFKLYQNVINSRFPDIGDIQDRDVEGVYITNTFDIQVEHSRLSEVSLDGFKQWLSQNPITVQYRLATESIKTVDLTTVDQDNQPTQLGTFENLTHVSLESAGLIPTVEMEVATRISTELASASPLMDDISTKQEQLKTTVDEQSNNVDATMIATTEIYEETL